MASPSDLRGVFFIAALVLGLAGRALAEEPAPIVPEFEESLKVSPDASRVQSAPELLVAAAAMEAGDYTLAARELQALTMKDSTNLDALRMLASAYLRQKAYARAVPVSERIAALDSTDAGVRVALGFLHEKLGDVDRSLMAYTDALEIDAEMIQAYQGLGWILLQRRQLQEAMNMIAKATELEPGYAPNYVLMGRVLTAQGFYENARQAFETAFRLDSRLREQYGILLQELVLRHRLGR